jgi:hypothetical protein
VIRSGANASANHKKQLIKSRGFCSDFLAINRVQLGTNPANHKSVLPEEVTATLKA